MWYRTFTTPSTIYLIYGDVLDFDRTFGGNRLRVGELFSVINGQNKLNADNVIEADFSRAVAKAA